VKRRDLETGVKCRAHDRVHLVLEQHEVPHHCSVIADAGEGRPGSEAKRRRHVDPRSADVEVGAWHRDLEDSFLLIELPPRTGELLDPRGVEHRCRSCSVGGVTLTS
jgi:hypothetical protein